MTRERALDWRRKIEKAAQYMPDEEAYDAQGLFPEWAVGIEITEHQKITYNGKLYKALLSHVAQESWAPSIAPTLFKEIEPSA